MHFLLQDGKGLAIINTLFCRDGSKALPEKKIYCELPETVWLCVREESEISRVQKSYKGRIWSRWGFWSKELQGQKKTLV